MIRVNRLSVTFNDKKVLDNVSFFVQDGERVAILGKSGSGKTVLLKSITGLIPFDGEVKVEGSIGFVFQLSALFDSFTVYKNLSLGLEEQGLAGEEIKNRVLSALQDVGLEENVARMFPEQLSGGMKKLVVIARVIALNPDHIFYDEPTTGLDPKIAQKIEDLIEKLNTERKITSIIVTHDLSLVRKLGKKIFFLKYGKLIPVEDKKRVWELYD